MQPDELTTAGTTMGTVSYMSPEQARGQVTDARTDLFSLGTVLYQMATGALPFQGETSAVVFEAILNREPAPVSQANPALPAELDRILGKALEKDRDLRYQTATDLKTDLLRLKRDTDSGGRRAAELADSRPGRGEGRREVDRRALLREPLRGQGRRVPPRRRHRGHHHGAVEDQGPEDPLAPHGAPVPRQVGHRRRRSGSSSRRPSCWRAASAAAGNRLRINAQLVDAQTDSLVWSERYDREMEDVFEVQDEIARKIAEALRITLSPQEQKALAAKPTDNLQAYDLYLRGKSYARRMTRQDLEFALQMFENAVALDPALRARPRGHRQRLRAVPLSLRPRAGWIERAKAASQRASALGSDSPEVGRRGVDPLRRGEVRRGGRARPPGDRAQGATPRAPTTCWAARCSPPATTRRSPTSRRRRWPPPARTTTSTCPILNALGALGKKEALRNMRCRGCRSWRPTSRSSPRTPAPACCWPPTTRSLERVDDAVREANLAMALRPNEATVLYNAACAFC